MQQLLAMAIRDILLNKVRSAITRLCFFFNAIYSKVIDPVKLDDLENKVAIKLCGPVYLWWMYPVQRYMNILKGYTKNLYCPKASIAERYISKEAIEFCSHYIERAKLVGLLESQHDKRVGGKGS